MRLVDADTLDKIKFHPLPYTHITPSDVNAESYERGWNDAIDAIMSEASTIEERKTGKWILCSERLPDAQTEVIVSCIDDSGDTRFLYTSSGWVTTNGEYWIVDNEINSFVIAWMPLPEPWRGEER